MPTIYPIPALNDNYIWMIVHPELKQAVIVDPGESQPVIDALKKNHLELATILITHHHWDHTNGIQGLLDHKKVPVYGPANDPVKLCDRPLQHGDQIELPNLEMRFRIIDIPGHTLGHIAYIGINAVFCGDTLFTGGCGRLFEGTAEQMTHSLGLLASLPPATWVYCAHEYTEANLRFAKIVEPNNPTLNQRIDDTQKLRTNNKPTVPSTIKLELQTNPFLRCQQQSVKQAVEEHCGRRLSDPIEVFAELRQWKDSL